MRLSANSQEYSVVVNSAPTAAWYERYVPFEVTVSDSGDPDDWYLVDPFFEGRHIEKKYCSKPVRKEGMAS